ncbi:MAG: aldehyde dehydrogenase family protein, partial [Candidatus Methanomethylophilaceae archaeon]
MDVINPANNRKIGEVQEFTEEMVHDTVGTLEKGFAGWSGCSPAARSRILFKAAEIVRQEKDRLASILTAEQGKPLHEAGNEILGAAAVMEFYASIAGTISGRTLPRADYGYAFTKKSPLGVCGAIIPWNMPALIMAWKVCPALVTGN